MRVLIASFIICFNLFVLCPRSSEAVDVQKQCDPDPGPMAIDYGDIIRCRISPAGDTDVFLFSGTAGDKVILLLSDQTSGSPSPCMTIVAPDGTSLYSNICASESVTPFGDLLPLPMSGMYFVFVSEEGADELVTYKLALHRFSPPEPEVLTLPLPYHVRLDSIRPPLDMDQFLIEGTANDTIQLSLKDRTSGPNAPVLYLIAPDGFPIGYLEPQDEELSQTIVLPETASYIVWVIEQGFDQNANYRITLECLSSDPGGCLDQVLPACAGKQATIVGTDGDNVILGTESDDVIVGLEGNDIIYGLGGRDTICGDQGDDTIFGGDRRDWLFGGDGNDVLRGEAGPDLLYGGDDNDSLDGGGGKDELSGENGCDTLFGGYSDDTLSGGPESDICHGGPDVAGDTADPSCELEVEIELP